MRKKALFWFFIFVLAIVPIASAAYVDIYPNYVIIKDRWPAVIRSGQTLQLEWELPESADLSSFAILDSDIDILSRIEAINKGSLVGKSVTVHTSAGSYTGVVKEDGGRLVLINPRNDQIIAIINASAVVSIIPGDDTASKNTLKLEVKNSGSTPVEDVNVRYFASGITWQVKYVLQVDGTEAVLKGEYEITNTTNTEIKDAVVRLIARQDPTYLYKTREVVLYAAAEASDAALPNVEHQGETAVYTLPGRITIPANSKLKLMLLKEDDLKLERTYKLNYDMVTVEYKLEGISQALPAGQIQVFDGDILMSTQSLASIPQSGELVLNLGQTMDIAGRTEQTNYTNVGELHTSEYAVTLKNNKDEKVTVEVVVNLPRDNARIVAQPGLEVKRTSSYTAIIYVDVEAKTERTINYTVEYTTNR